MTSTENDPPDESTTDANPADETPAAESAAAETPAEETAAVDVEPVPDAPLELGEGEDPKREALLTRIILPIALPILSALVLLVFVVNLSRAFLAGGSDGALVIGTLAIFVIMGIAALLSATPRVRSSSLVMIVSSVFVIVISAGLISIGPSSEEEGAAGGFQEPKGPAVATVEVDALPSLKFQSKAFTTKPGVNLIKYVDKGGNHTLVFDDPAYTGFELKVPPNDEGKIDLKPGSFQIYCTIPGHRAAGMEATLTVK